MDGAAFDRGAGPRARSVSVQTRAWGEAHPMRGCPVCGGRYEVATGFCPMDGAGLVDLEVVGMMSTEDAIPTNASYVSPRAVGGGGGASLMAAARPVPSSGAVAGAQALAAVASAYDHAHAQDYARAPVPRETDDLVGQVLEGRYRIEKRIGIGGMGVVFRALQTTIEKPMAVKVLKSAHARDQQISKRFSQEARLASQIKHPNVVDILDFGTAPNGSPFYVMEYLEGHSLAHQIDYYGRLEPARAYEIAIQVARALSAAHRESIIHRDLKPDNIFLCPAPSGHGMEDLVKILDFGIARATARKTRLTAAGAVVGTPEYMSPEQSQASDTDHRTDIYALGIILFEMLVGRVPFKADTMVGTLTKQVFESAPRLNEAEPSLQILPSTDDLIARMLGKLPEERPQTAVDAIRQLEEAAERDLGADASPAGLKRATVAIGSWSVGDNAAPATPAANKGPIIAPPSQAASFRVSSSIGGPLAAGAELAVTPRRRPSVIAVGSSHPDVSEAASRAQAAASRAATPGPTQKQRLLPLLLLGTGAAVFAAFMTVGLMRFFGANEAAAAREELAMDRAKSAAAEETDAKEDTTARGAEISAEPTPAQIVVPPEAPETPEEVDPVVEGPTGAPDAPVEPKTEPKTKGKKKKGKTPKGQPSGDSGKTGQDEPPEPETKVQDPPEPPSVSLGDLKDPFAEK